MKRRRQSETIDEELPADEPLIDPARWGGWLQNIAELDDEKTVKESVSASKVYRTLRCIDQAVSAFQVMHTAFDLQRDRDPLRTADQANSPLLDQLVAAVDKMPLHATTSPEFLNQCLLALSKRGSVEAWRFLLTRSVPPTHLDAKGCIEAAVCNGQIELLRLLYPLFQKRWTTKSLMDALQSGQEEVFFWWYELRPVEDIKIRRPEVLALLDVCMELKCPRALQRLVDDQLIAFHELHGWYTRGLIRRLFHVKDDSQQQNALQCLQIVRDAGAYGEEFYREVINAGIPYIQWHRQHYPNARPFPYISGHLGNVSPATLSFLMQEGLFGRVDLLDGFGQLLTETTTRDPLKLTKLQLFWDKLDRLPNRQSLADAEIIPDELIQCLRRAIFDNSLAVLEWLIDTVGMPFLRISNRVLSFLVCSGAHDSYWFLKSRGLVVPVDCTPVFTLLFSTDDRYTLFGGGIRPAVKFIREVLFKEGGDPSLITPLFKEALQHSPHRYVCASAEIYALCGVPLPPGTIARSPRPWLAKSYKPL